jgi:hypothetical protein
MENKLFGILIASRLYAGVCLAQSSDSQLTTNWGEPAFSVQLSIESSNKVFFAGSTNIISAKIRNSSTNFIYIVELNPMTDTAFFLTSKIGKTYRLTPSNQRNPSEHISISANIYPFNHELNVNETYEFSAPVVISTNIDTGSYQLKAVRYFVIGKNRRESHEIESNLLEVEVK